MNSKQDLMQAIAFQFFIWVFVPIAHLGLSILYYSAYIAVQALNWVILLPYFKQLSHSTKELIMRLKPYPRIYQSATSVISEQGYHFESHKIVTEDGYILTAWRIFKNPNLLHPHPIILQHGLLDCSWSWFINNTKEQTLPYILADQGYDVWLANNRGNKYSIGHTTLRNPNYNQQYWDFSFDELAKYDVKAINTYVRTTTMKNQVIYIGHSQGTTQMFAHLSTNISFQNNMKCFIAFGPAIYVSNLQSTFIRCAINSWFFEFLAWLGIPYFFTFSDSFNIKIGALCDMVPWIFRRLLFLITNLLCGFPKQNKIDLSKFGFMVSHEPGGCSTRNLVQWMQFFRERTLAYFDYGRQENMIRYGTATAPEYPLQNLRDFTIPKYLFVGTKDIIADSEDVQKMIKLMDQTHLHVEFIDDYAHLDYVWSVDAHKKLYPQILKIIKDNQI